MIYASREFVDVGGLMTYSVNYPDLYRRAAGLVDKIFKGVRPGDLPVEQPALAPVAPEEETAAGWNSRPRIAALSNVSDRRTLGARSSCYTMR